jgi:hypothetical protein
MSQSEITKGRPKKVENDVKRSKEQMEKQETDNTMVGLNPFLPVITIELAEWLKQQSACLASMRL